MKILFTLTLLLFTLTQERKFDNIEIDNIIVKDKLNQSYNFGPANELQKAFGKAKIKKEKDEVLGGYGYTFIGLCI